MRERYAELYDTEDAALVALTCLETRRDWRDRSRFAPYWMRARDQGAEDLHSRYATLRRIARRGTDTAREDRLALIARLKPSMAALERRLKTAIGDASASADGRTVTGAENRTALGDAGRPPDGGQEAVGEPPESGTEVRRDVEPS